MKNKDLTILLFLFAFLNVFLLNLFNQSGNEQAIKWQLIITVGVLVVLLLYKLVRSKIK